MRYTEVDREFRNTKYYHKQWMWNLEKESLTSVRDQVNFILKQM